MGLKLSSVQSLTRFHAKARNLTITSGEGLLVANQVLDAMCSPDGEVVGKRVGRRWRELSVSNSAITTVADQEEYTWPIAPEKQFAEDPYIELLDTSASNDPWPIVPCSSEERWSALDILDSGTPTDYRFIVTGGSIKIAFRPNPDTAGDTIRITGQRLPDEFVNSESHTPFMDRRHDKALAILIAAEYRAQQESLEDAMRLVTQAIGLMPKNEFQPRVTPSHIRPWGGRNYARNLVYPW